MKKWSLFIMILFYALAGINHFVHPAFYVKIMPPWLPAHDELVLISGVAEILFAVLLLFNSTRRFAAWGIIALLVAVFPANVQMFLNYLHDHDPKLWISMVRLPLQLILILWAYRFTKTRQ